MVDLEMKGYQWLTTLTSCDETEISNMTPPDSEPQMLTEGDVTVEVG